MEDGLRIAQVAPAIESVPPKMYGGTERVVSYLTEALVEAGHQVTLCASRDSETDADLFPTCERGLRQTGQASYATSTHLAMLERIYRRADEFDIIHSHVDQLAYPFARRCSTPTLSTMHGRLDLPLLDDLYREYDDVPLVSISYAQRRPMPDESWWAANIYHGLPLDQYTLEADDGDYLAFIGRASPEKRIDSAIHVALETGVPLKIAAKVDDSDREHFETKIEPMLDNPLIEFVGEIDEDQKQAFLGNAAALLFMVDWPEPFGLAMIEAMACGTPVIARKCGSIPEVVDEGVTGYVCQNESGAIEAVRRLDALDRRKVRRQFEERFSVETMAQNYVDTYRALIAKHRSATDPWSGVSQYPQSRA